MHSLPEKNIGFTLVELAVVLLIIGLLVGGLLVPLATQVEQRDRREVKLAMEQIKQALLGYAVINGSLPCPATEADPASSAYGTPTMDAAECGEEGILPWKVLGVNETDPWGRPRTSATDSWIGYWRYRVDTNFTSNINMTTTPDENLSVQRVSVGNTYPLTASGADTPVIIIYSTGPNRTADGLNADANQDEYQGGVPIGDTFDDVTDWMTRPILLSTMLYAKVLP